MIEGQAIVPVLDRHAFRGEFLAWFALIEDHLAPAIDRVVDLGFANKPPHLFGQKFELIRKHLSDERIWQHREHIAKVISDLADLAVLRGLVCHGVMKDAIIEGEHGFSIRPPGNTDWRARMVLSDAEADELLKTLANLTRRLLKQTLKKPVTSTN